MDYRARCFHRNGRGMKDVIVHSIDAIQNFSAKDIRQRYMMVDVNVYQANIFHTKMRLKELELDTYLFGEGASELPPREAKRIRERVNHEIMEIFSAQNFTQ